MKNQLQNKIVYFLLIILMVIMFSVIGMANKSAPPPVESTQQEEVTVPSPFTQPIEFSHKIHIEKGAIPCEFCHIYARRSINSGAPAMASCFGCHGVIQGSDEDPQKAAIFQDAIKKVLEYKPKGTSIPWKKIHDVPDFVHFSHKRHIQVGFDCTECHGEIDQYDMLSMQTMITDLSMGWCVECHKNGRQTINGKIADSVRETRGGKIVSQVAKQQIDGVLLGSKDCYTCHK